MPGRTHQLHRQRGASGKASTAQVIAFFNARRFIEHGLQPTGKKRQRLNPVR